MTNIRGDLTGEMLGSCLLEKCIGQGGMGTVYLARQTRPARSVAVKILLPNFAMNSQVYQEFLARFRREADVIAKLEHVNIMPIYEYGEQDGLAYLVMPYFIEGSLRDRLAKCGALTLQEAISYMDQAASALDYAHSQGVIHRDLKPANFLLHADGRLVLADFGIARIMEERTPGATLTSTGSLLGTPEYMAPEMAQGQSVDYHADIYELGIVLFQLMSGRVPFTGNTLYAVMVKHIQESLPLLHQINPAISPEVDAIIQKATAKHPEDRYSTVREMAQALHSISVTSLIPHAVHASNSAGQGSTILSPSRPLKAPVVVQHYNTPPSQQQLRETIPPHQSWPNVDAPSLPPRADTPESSVASSYPTYQTPARTPSTTQQLGLYFIGILLVLVLMMGSVLVGVEINRGVHRARPAFNAARQIQPFVAETAPLRLSGSYQRRH